MKEALKDATAKGEDNARWAMRNELAARDFRVQEAESELAGLQDAKAQGEKRVKVRSSQNL